MFLGGHKLIEMKQSLKHILFLSALLIISVSCDYENKEVPMKTRSTSSKNLPENCVEKRVQNDRIEKTEYQNCNSLKYRNILHRPDRIIRAFFSSFHRLCI